MIWFTSDSHYGHHNICKSVSNWNNKDGCRDFATLEEMNDKIVDVINIHVKEDDTLYHLGDWSFGGIDNVWNFRKRIKCENITLILGNHDDHIRKHKILPNCHIAGFGKEGFFKDGPPDVNKDFSVFGRSLFSYVLEYYSFFIGKQEFILHHHPVEHWKDAEKGSIHLHGHLHGKIDNCELNSIYKRMDVCLERDWRPYSVDDIMQIMSKRKNLKRDNE